jgi:jouberin
MITIKELTTASLAPSTILFFEVVDFSPAKRDAPGWHYIAWAFLKVFSNQGAANIGPKCKLQLYTYTSWPHTSNVSLEGSTCHVWRMWSRHHREKYSGSLTVSLHSLVVDDEEEVTQDRTWLDLTEENADLYQQGGLEEQDYPKKGKNQVVPWSRLPGELCTVPTHQSVAMQGGSKGGTALAFSKDGRKLAVAMADEGAYPIGIFSIPDGEKLGVLAGHVNCIHNLSWSHDDYIIVSASSDCTARCWILGATPSQLYLPHPSYVYSTKFHPTVPYFVISGGYDAILRGWRIVLPTATSEQPFYELLFEHSTLCSHINTLCYSSDGSRLYTGHGKGEIGAWMVSQHEDSSPAISQLDRRTSCFEGKTVIHIEMHPLGNRLLVQARGSPPCLVDLRIDRIQSTFKVPFSINAHSRASLCSCGTHTLSIGDSGSVYVWNTETGQVVKEIENLPTSGTIVYHPHDNLFAMVTYGNREFIRIFWQ